MNKQSQVRSIREGEGQPSPPHAGGLRLGEGAAVSGAVLAARQRRRARGNRDDVGWATTLPRCSRLAVGSSRFPDLHDDDTEARSWRSAAGRLPLTLRGFRKPVILKSGGSQKRSHGLNLVVTGVRVGKGASTTTVSARASAMICRDWAVEVDRLGRIRRRGRRRPSSAPLSWPCGPWPSWLVSACRVRRSSRAAAFR